MRVKRGGGRVTDALFKEDIAISAKDLLIDMSCMKGRSTVGWDRRGTPLQHSHSGEKCFNEQFIDELFSYDCFFS